MKKYSLYVEKEDAGNKWRNDYLKELLGFIAKEKEQADKERRKYFSPSFASVEAYEADTVKFREEYKRMLGIPYFDRFEAPTEPVEKYEVAEDTLSRIYRVRVPIVKGLKMYGILFLVDSGGKAPLVIHPHGGHGTPERTYGFFSEGYHEMVRRFLLRKVSIFMPQLLLWVPETDGDQYNRFNVDMNLKQLGTSLAGLEVYSIQKAIDWLVGEEGVDPERIGMAGLSYGGYYTLLTTAADTRIKAGYVSGAYKDSFLHNDRDDATDMTFEGAARKFLDNEFIKLICPRPLFIEAASDDYYFDAEASRLRSFEAAETYDSLGIRDRFKFRIFEGIHEYPRDDEGLDFVLEHL